jgi:phage gpG-like protein
MDGILLDTSELAGPLQELEARGRGISHLLPVISEDLKAAVEDVYEEEGPGWKDLADSTKKARRGDSYKILQDTSVMILSTGTNLGADWAEAFAGASYADFHATGTKNMAQRNPFDLGPFEDPFLRDVADLLLEDLTK